MSSIRIESLRKSYGDVTALRGISLDIPSGQVVALLGPSGCGKTTTLKCLGGLETPSAGAIYIGDRLVADGRQASPPEQRDIGMVFQLVRAVAAHDGGPRRRRIGLEVRREAKTGVRRPNGWRRRWPSMQLSELGDRYPQQLTAAEQQQRVALARMLVTRPGALPHGRAAVEPRRASSAPRMRAEICKLLQGSSASPPIYVTHDQTEAMAICDRVALMNGGRHRARTAPPEDLYARPASRFVAQFVGGGNLLQGSLAGWDAGTRTATVRAAGLTIQCALPAAPAPDAAVQVVLRRQGLSPRKGTDGRHQLLADADARAHVLRVPDRIPRGRGRGGAHRPVGGRRMAARRRGIVSSAPSSTVLGFAGEPAAG